MTRFEQVLKAVHTAPRQWLVTGGAGFIGSFVVDRLRAAGHEAVIFDVRPSPHHEPGEVPTVIGDVLDYDALVKAARGCDVIAHLAAAADVGEVAADPLGAEELNARGTLHVLEAARELGLERVIYASTIWVYSEAEGRVDEEAALRPPAHLYTATKLAGELYCHAYGELYGLDTTILRFGIPFGPRARPAAVVPAFVRKALDGVPLTIAGTGEQTRRFVYVEDLAEGVVRAMAPAAANRVYNLVGDEDVSIRQIATTVSDLVGDTAIEHTPARAGDFGGRIEISGERALSELGWQPGTEFREGVSKYVAWQRRKEAETTPSRWASVRRRLAPSAGVGLTVAAAGLFGAFVTRYDAVTDPLSFLALLVLLVLPLVIVAGVDWNTDRSRVGLVAGAMLIGVMVQGLMSEGSDYIHTAKHHERLFVIVTVILLVVAVWGVRRASRVSQSDPAG
jgi:UDP-glucose 4-epimerase